MTVSNGRSMFVRTRTSATDQAIAPEAAQQPGVQQGRARYRASRGDQDARTALREHTTHHDPIDAQTGQPTGTDV